MTPRERLLAALRGEPVDRVPIYTLIPFAVTPSGFKPAPFHGGEEPDRWREKDPAYGRLVRRMENECDNLFIWRPSGMQSDRLTFGDVVRRQIHEEQRDGKRFVTLRFETNGMAWQEAIAAQPGAGHTWQIEHCCKSPEDARRLLEIPYEAAPGGAEDFFDLQALLGERGVMWVTVPSPLQVVCRLFDPTEFLMMVRTEAPLIARLMGVFSERIAFQLKHLLQAGVGPIIRFGGAEHATPPMMSPADFDELVVGYDAPLVRLCKEHARMTAVHCHGRIRHALQRFVEMGMDQTDPVEASPDGDLSLTEARALAGDQITLTGNIQMRELSREGPEHIEARVRDIVRQAGPRRLIISTTGTPLERISPRLEENYHRLIDAAIRCG
jgi:hypothetical protein